MAQTFNTSISFVQSTSRKDRRKGAGSLSVSAFGRGVGNVADSATQAWVRNNFVDKTTEQEISAPKIFSQGIKIGDIAFYKHPDGYVYLDETLVLKGGVVMYGNGSGVEVPSIFESLPIDNYTIKRDGNGALYVDETALSISGGGGGGGVADSVHWNNVTGKPSWIGSTKPSYKYSEIEEKPDLSVYAKTTDIPSLNGYATQTWVENKGYLLATTASSIYQSKITSSNKLSYSLISGTPTIPTKLSQLTDDVVAGNYLSTKGGTINGSLTATSFIGNLTGNADSATTIYLGNSNANGAFPVPFVSNKTVGNKSLFVSTTNTLIFNPSTGGLSAKSFIGNLTGNADSATKLATARTIWGQSFDGTKDITGAMTVDGDATFSSKVVIDGISLRRVDNYLYLDSSLVLSGGVTMYGDDGTTVKPIWESIPLDDSTLAWVNGELTVIGGTSGSGGGISEEFLNVKLQNYQPLLSTTNKLPYSLISGTPDLSVYFLASNFTKANIKSTLGISDWALASAKPTYTASEVGALGVNGTAQSALKMTPEYLTDLNNATPWRFFDMNTGYGSTDGNKPNIAWVSGITGTAAGSSNYRWQLAMTTGSQNPYFRREHDGNWNNWSTLAFTSNIPTKLSQLTDDVVAGNYLSTNGGTISKLGRDLLIINDTSSSTVNRGAYITFTSKADDSQVKVGYNTSTGAFFNIANSTTGKTYTVRISKDGDGVSYDNQPILHSGNVGDYALPITGGTVSGSITATSFIGNLTGNADSATYIQTKMQSSDAFYPDKYKAYIQWVTGNTAAIKFTDGDYQFRADSATKLATARTIWGQSFDGTKDITGAMTVDGDVTFSSKVVIGTIPVYQSADGTLFVDANVVFRGGVAMYGNTTTTITEE